MDRDEYLTGIILSMRNFREYDRIISFYCKEHGKIKVFVRSARKSASKLAPIISEPFAILKIKIVRGKNHHHLIGGEIKEHFKNIGMYYNKLTQVNLLFSKINKLISFRKSDSKILSLIITFLRKVNALPVDKVQVLFPAFLIKFLSFLGYRPEIKQCVICHKSNLTDGIFFDLEKGGVACKKHSSDNSEFKMNINPLVLQILQNLLYKDFNFLIEQELNKKDLQSAEVIIDKFYQWHVE